jgi:hypothetical protein
MTGARVFAAFALACLVAIAYLFVSAPERLPERGTAAHEESVDARQLLEMCAAEQAIARKLYTSAIVGPGLKVGLRFSEDWRNEGVEAGPLPALFLRETARNLEKRPVPLGLFLGSDFPISQSNLFQGQQAEVFAELRADREPRHFVTEDTGLHTAMFPDLAVAPPCVDCHNDHAQSPKQDWKLDDVMGATTWTYPKARVSAVEALEVIAALRESLKEAYASYIAKSRTFASPPTVGDQWPDNGYHIPTPEEFMKRAEQQASQGTLSRLLAHR